MGAIHFARQPATRSDLSEDMKQQQQRRQTPARRLWNSVVFVLISHAHVDAIAGGDNGRVPVTTSAVKDAGKVAAEDDAIVAIMSRIRSWQEEYSQSETDNTNESFVTLTYAQSLDGCVAVMDSKTGETSSNLPLSGKSSLRLTHGLRSIHDAVLVGGTTFAVDNPRLNVRMWPEGKVGCDEPEYQHQLRPVILDTELKSLVRLRQSAGGGIRAQNPIICCGQDVFDLTMHQPNNSLASGVDILPCKRDSEGNGLDLEDVLKQLRNEKGICSVMVEGGASILTAFANRGLAHCVCVTIAPKIIGGRLGLNAFAGYEPKGVEKSMWCNFEGSDCMFVPGIGSDCIFLARWPRDC